LFFALALACAATMGLAIQRGATCMVAAVDELLSGAPPRRLVALAEAAVWVGAGILLLRMLGVSMFDTTGYRLAPWTLAGAALLGLGAVVNGACVFGALARLGSGEWAYAATPLGFFVGCLSADALFGHATPQELRGPSPLLSAPAWVAWLAAAGLLLRVVWAIKALTVRRDVPRRAAWSPHAAPMVISMTFQAMAVLAGAWAFTDVLADVARGMAQSVGARVALAVALVAGAVGGGALAGLLRPVVPSTTAISRCFIGGLMMGWGSLLVPGGNDGLLLLAMPSLWPYAWAAFVAMCLSIAVGLTIVRRATS